MAKKKIDLPTLAERYKSLKDHLKTQDEAYKAQIAPLEAELEKVGEELMIAMKTAGMASFRTENGDAVARSSRTTFKITDEEMAMDWARDHGCLRVDATKANKILLKEIFTPEGFEQHDTEFLSIRKE